MPSGLMTPASWVAMFTQRYMHECGIKAEHLGHVCVSQRNHAVKNPAAFFYEKPLTMEEHASARPIVEPLRLFDCCQETDGGTACIVTTPERARDLDKPAALIRSVAQGAGFDQEVMTSFYRPDITELCEMDIVARQCYDGSWRASASASAASPATSWPTATWTWAAVCPATPTAASSPRPTSTG
jgi:acetyl-CoA acetyltransferase